VQKIYHDSGITAWTTILVIAKKHAWDNESKESEAEVQETEPTLILKPKTKSAVWNFFM